MIYNIFLFNKSFPIENIINYNKYINIRKIISTINNKIYIFFWKINNTLFLGLYILYDKNKLKEFTYN